MAKVDLAASLQGSSDVRALAGRTLGLGLVAVGTSGQGIGRKVAPRPTYPKETLKVVAMTVKGQTP